MFKKPTGALMMAFLCLLAGCAPPVKNSHGLSSSGDTGHPIIKVTPVAHPAFKIVTIDGVEYRQARGGIGKFGGTFIDNQIGDGPKTFNPWASFDATSSTLGGMLASGLVDTDAYTGEVIPYLAKSVSVQPDHLTYVVTLRKGLVWSDGKPLTSKDVVFTWNNIVSAGLGNPSMRDNTRVGGKSPSVRALDPLTIEFKTAKPFAPFLRQLGEPIAPQHIFAPLIAKGGPNAFSSAWGTNDAIKHPKVFVSSGMWLLDHYEPGERAVFKRNPHFAMVDQKGGKLPYLDRYVVEFVKDLNNQALQFEQGKADTYTVPGRNVSHMRTLTQPDFKLYNLGPSSGTTFLTFNLNARINPETGKPAVAPVKSHWFNNLKFRQALDWAVDRDGMVKNILLGVGSPLYTSESLASIYLNQALAKGHPQNLQKAKALLKEGGFHWNDKGQLLDDQNHLVEFSLYTNTGNDQREATGVSIKEDLASLGIKVNFKPMEFNVLVGKMGTSDWEAIIMGLTGSNLEPHDGANVWRSDGALHLFNQRNAKVKNSTADVAPWEKNVDSLLEEGSQTFDTGKRKQIYNRLQEVISEQVPFIYLYSPLTILAVRSRVQNFDPTPLSPFHNMEEIWIRE